jgi:hypothetical protein
MAEGIFISITIVAATFAICQLFGLAIDKISDKIHDHNLKKYSKDCFTPTIVVDWLRTMPEEYAQRAINNMYNPYNFLNKNAYKNCSSVSEALRSSFLWIPSPEGIIFWLKVAEYYTDLETNGKTLLKLPKIPKKNIKYTLSRH